MLHAYFELDFTSVRLYLIFLLCNSTYTFRDKVGNEHDKISRLDFYTNTAGYTPGVLQTVSHYVTIVCLYYTEY